MTDSIKTISGLVTALGGREAVAKLLRIEPQAVSMWRGRGFIPRGHHVDLIFACWRLGRAVEPAVFELKPDAFDDLVVPAALSVTPPRDQASRGRRRVA